MASNPMQRQARNFFLLGMVITLLIAGAIGALLYTQMNKIKKENEQYANSLQTVYVLNQDVKSGDIISTDMFSTVKAAKKAIPSDYIEPSTVISAYSLYTKDGIKITMEYVEGVQHLYLNGDKTAEVKKDVEADKYFVSRNNNKEFIETVEVPVIAKIDIKANTVFTPNLVVRSNEVLTDDVREQEYNMFVLPADLLTGDYVDVRLLLPNGQDYIVVSKKRIDIPTTDNGISTDTVHMQLAEEEILSLSCAIVEAFKIEGSKLYVNKYVDAGTQEASTPTYVVNNEVARLMDADPNIVEKAKNALYTRYNTSNLKSLREQNINNVLSNSGEEEAYKSKMQESITSTKETRQNYLQSITPTTGSTEPTSTEE